MNSAIYHRSSSSNDTPSFRDMLILMREEAVIRQLAIYIENLNRLEIRKAKYGLDVPIHLSNEIEYTREQIDFLNRELRREEGPLAELEALPQGEWWLRVDPFLPNRRARTVV